MATQHRIDPRVTSSDGPSLPAREEPHVRDLLKQLAGDGSELIRNEMALAKLEMREMARELAADSAKVGMAIGIALSGALVLLAAAVIGLGHVLDGRFGLAALIVGVVMLAAGALLATAVMKRLRDMPRRPEQTVRSLERDRQWARREIREFKEEVRS
jgi:uncharacterized membrane protein YqjE